MADLEQITRADALRQMSNFELADWLWKITDCYLCPAHLNAEGCSRYCDEELEHWLNEKIDKGEKL